MVAQFPHRVICLIFVVCLFSAVASGQDQRGARPDGIPGPAPLKGLMIAGGCCHDYPNQIQILTEGISQRVNIEWEIVRGFSPRDRKLPIYQTEDWAQGYDVVVHNECYGGVVDVDFVERIVRGHRKHGIPVVAIHCSMHSYRNAKTDAWRELLGVTSMRHEKQVNDGVEVINRAPGHPIMQ